MTVLKKSIYYFQQEGKQNKENVLKIVIETAQQNQQIKKIIVFTSDGEIALKLKKQLPNHQIIAVTFPYMKQFKIKKDKDYYETIIPETSKKEVQNNLKKEGIILLQGVLPFEDIIIPYNSDTKIQTINYTLSLFGGGMKLCVEALIVATDSGAVEPGEEAIVMSADTAIIATGSRKEWLFHPVYGMQIKEILCKPINFNITKKSQ
ncbi:hypothetical protein BBF96_01000 [Anoxybacter fermentans]|uniref:Pyruvate kinase C-terminal domain-containing protein n=1 Tax=Anoxybacter fermentans TaxID=1323375 RepID=A0A3Q9HQ38_9FIRM|nr:pyruvate kinase alpha/beta domain-containing protein [Anoxybacter fermentans]AZR72091.1 hypothetical protein BBF96_01000 [Anoxybacter fermentans]